MLLPCCSAIPVPTVQFPCLPCKHGTVGTAVPRLFTCALRRSHQILYSEGIQSEDFYQERHIFYIWTLDLLYHTLHAAMKSDELIKVLSKPFIPSVACILFPRRIKRVQKAVSAYLEKVSQRAGSDPRTPTDICAPSSVRRIWTPQE